MAKASIALAEFVEKGAHDGIVRELLSQNVAERLMEFEVEQRTGAEHGERTPDRSNSRNGYRDRLWETRVGSVDLRIPKLRRGSYTYIPMQRGFTHLFLLLDWCCRTNSAS
jgi:putative transposase